MDIAKLEALKNDYSLLEQMGNFNILDLKQLESEFRSVIMPALIFLPIT